MRTRMSAPVMPSIVVGICVGSDVGRRPMTVTVPSSRLRRLAGRLVGAGDERQRGAGGDRRAKTQAPPRQSRASNTLTTILGSRLAARPATDCRRRALGAASSRCAKMRAWPSPTLRGSRSSTPPGRRRAAPAVLAAHGRDRLADCRDRGRALRARRSAAAARARARRRRARAVERAELRARARASAACTTARSRCILPSTSSCFTAVLYFTGGPTNPFVSLYLVPISLAATSLPARLRVAHRRDVRRGLLAALVAQRAAAARARALRQRVRSAPRRHVGELRDRGRADRAVRRPHGAARAAARPRARGDARERAARPAGRRARHARGRHGARAQHAAVDARDSRERARRDDDGRRAEAAAARDARRDPRHQRAPESDRRRRRTRSAAPARATPSSKRFSTSCCGTGPRRIPRSSSASRSIPRTAACRSSRRRRSSRRSATCSTTRRTRRSRTAASASTSRSPCAARASTLAVTDQGAGLDPAVRDDVGLKVVVDEGARPGDRPAAVARGAATLRRPARPRRTRRAAASKRTSTCRSTGCWPMPADAQRGVLVVDDDERFAMTLAMALARRGYAAHVAHDAAIRARDGANERARSRDRRSQARRPTTASR